MGFSPVLYITLDVMYINDFLMYKSKPLPRAGLDNKVNRTLNPSSYEERKEEEGMERGNK
jgi:hypothetical protein